MIVRDISNADFTAAEAAIRAAFGRADEARLVLALRGAGDVVYELVAEAEAGAVVGHVLLSRLVAPEGALALAPLSVLPARQGRGIAGALVNAAIASASADGWAAIFVLGEPGSYERYGFTTAAAARFVSPYPKDYMLALETSPGALSGRAGEIIYPTPFQDLG